MEVKAFYIIYLKALEQALANDYVNETFFVKGPDYYIDKKQLTAVDNFIDQRINEVAFLDKVAYYFFELSHYSTSINNMPIEDYKKSIINDIKEIRLRYNI